MGHVEPQGSVCEVKLTERRGSGTSPSGHSQPYCRGFNNCQYYGPRFLMDREWLIPQMYLKMLLVIVEAPTAFLTGSAVALWSAKLGKTLLPSGAASFSSKDPAVLAPVCEKLKSGSLCRYAAESPGP